jgi:hypothetical protein
MPSYFLIPVCLVSRGAFDRTSYRTTLWVAARCTVDYFKWSAIAACNPSQCDNLASPSRTWLCGRGRLVLLQSTGRRVNTEGNHFGLWTLAELQLLWRWCHHQIIRWAHTCSAASVCQVRYQGAVCPVSNVFRIFGLLFLRFFSLRKSVGNAKPPPTRAQTRTSSRTVCASPLVHRRIHHPASSTDTLVHPGCFGSPTSHTVAPPTPSQGPEYQSTYTSTSRTVLSLRACTYSSLFMHHRVK